jgi:hypothetical protein
MEDGRRRGRERRRGRRDYYNRGSTRLSRLSTIITRVRFASARGMAI